MFVWARAKLAEINPLIVTLPIAEDTSSDEVALFQLFDYLCEPIRLGKCLGGTHQDSINFTYKNWKGL